MGHFFPSGQAKQPSLLTVCALTLASAMFPVSISAAPATPQARYGGTLTETTLGDPKSFNYWTAMESSTSNAVAPLLGSLIRLNPRTLRWEGDLAELPVISSDGLTWRFRLKPDLKWSDGQPLTVDDVLFTLNLIYDPEVDTLLRYSMMMEVLDKKTGKMKPQRVQARGIDDRTVEFILPTVYAPAREVLSFPIAPRHKLLEAYSERRFNNAWSINTNVQELVSSGPWVVHEYKPGKSIVYTRNPHYWKKDSAGGALPYLDKYTILITSDLEAKRRLFQQGKSDVLEVQSPALYQELGKKLAKNSRIYSLGASWSNSYLCFNQNPNSKVEKYKIALFRDVRFRRAVSHAINRDAMIKRYFGGKGHTSWSPISSANTAFYNPAVPKYGFDVRKAKQLLREMGLRDRNGNGYLEKNGREVRINLVTNAENSLRKNLGQAVCADLKRVGLRATVTPVSFNRLVASLDAPKSQFEVVLLGFTGSYEPHNAAEIWRSSGRLHQWWPQQKKPSTPWEAEIDRLFVQGAKTLDLNARRKIYNRWQVLAAQNLPFIPLPTGDQFVAVRNHFGNLQPTPAGGVTWNLEEIYDVRATDTAPG